MPMAHDRKAPRFSSDPACFEDFFSDVKELAKRAALGDEDTIKWARRYAGIEGNSWRFVPCMVTPNAKPTIDEFMEDVRKCYPHLNADSEFTNHDLDQLVQRTSNSARMSRDDFGEYYRKFLNCASSLIKAGDLSERERNKAFIDGFPKPVRDKVLARLAIVVPQRKPSKGYEFSDAHRAVSFIFDSGTGDDSDSAAEPKKEPAERTTMDDLAQAMSEMTRMFMASVQDRAMAPPPCQTYANAQPTPGGVVQNAPWWNQSEGCMFCSAHNHYV